MKITEDQFRKTLGLFPTGVTVVTARRQEGGDAGITISSLTSVSLQPPQILFCLSKHSKSIPAFRASRFFAVNILKATQASLSDGFAGRVPIEWEKLDTHRHSETGCLLLSEALGHIICEKGVVYDGGDHDIILGQVIDLNVAASDLPLVRQRGQYLTTCSLSEELSCEPVYKKSNVL